MLDTKAFVRWAKENVIVLFAHNELGHEPVEEERATTGEREERCPLYPGLTCRDHLNIAVDIDSGMRGLLPTVPFLELCPNTWLVLPSGQVEQVLEEDQFVAAKIQAAVKKAQATLGRPVGLAAWERCRARLAASTEAADAERWREALTALAALAEDVKTPAPPLAALLAERVREIEEPVTWAFEELVDDDALEPGQRRARVEALRRAVDVEIHGKRPAVHGVLDAWLKADGR